MAERQAKKMILDFKKSFPNFKYNQEYFLSEEFSGLTKKLKQWFYPKLEDDLGTKALSPRALKAKMQRMASRMNALINSLNQMHFNSRKPSEVINSDLRTLFILTAKASFDEIIMTPGLLNDNDEHLSLAYFEELTGLTTHYDLAVAENLNKPISAFMQVKSFDIDWQDQSLNVLKDLFELDDEQAQKIVTKLSLIYAEDLELEGFNRILYRMPVVNIAGSILDQQVYPRLHDPDIKKKPLSTAIHEITHGLIQDRYPEIFSPYSDDAVYFKEVDFNLPNGKRLQFQLHQYEELVCQALSVLICPTSSVRSLILSNIGNEANPSSEFAEYLHLKYGLYDNKRAMDPGVLSELVKESRSMLKGYLNQLDQIKD